jgi:GNAT superfamily N-acetyltransferase
VKPTLRLATDADREAVRALCEHLDPHDYLPGVWDAWLHGAGNQMLLAHSGATLAGCVFAAPVAPGQIFSQGLRVHPDYRRLGVATLLMNEQGRMLRERGFHVARGVTGAANRRARAFFATVGWREIEIIHRRRAPGWHAGSAYTACSSIGRESMLVSREGVAHFRRIFWSADRAWLDAAAREGRWHECDDACVLLDPPSSDFGTWAVALEGRPDALGALLRDLSPPWSAGGGLTVESNDRPALQSMLDWLGFEPPEDSYVVVECAL